MYNAPCFVVQFIKFKVPDMLGCSCLLQFVPHVVGMVFPLQNHAAYPVFVMCTLVQQFGAKKNRQIVGFVVKA